MTKRVLITGARAAAALDLARDFYAASWDVHIADCRKVRMASWSNLPAKMHIYAPPTWEAERFQSDLRKLVQTINPDAIVPTCEEVFHLAAPGLRDPMQSILFAPSLTTLRALHDKFAFVSACREWGLNAPESHLLTNAESLTQFAQEAGIWVFKPPFSRFGESAHINLTSKGILDLQLSAEKPVIAQRKVRGDEVSFYAVAQAGQLTAFAAYQSQWRLRGGASFAFTPVSSSLRTQLKAIAKQIAHHTKITGQFACDAIVAADGTLWLIECNPRATSGVHLLAGSGSLALAIADGKPMPDALPTQAYLAPAMAVFGLPLALRSGRVAQWRETMRHGRDAISRPDDRMPILGALADAAGFALTGLKRGISTTTATTRDIEWNGEALP